MSMWTRRFQKLGQVPLRDHATAAQIASVWQRIEQELPDGVSRTRAPAWSRIAWVACATFAAGLWVGSQFVGGTSPKGVAASAVDPSAIHAVSGELERTQVPGRERGQPAGAPAQAGEAWEGAAERSARLRAVPTAKVPLFGGTEAASASAEPSTTSEPNVETAPVVVQWTELAARGDYVEAARVLADSGGFDVAIASGSASQLMLLVDVARATGQRAFAIQSLRRVLSHFGSDALAPLAAWSLGNMLEKSGDRAGATEAFALYRALSPQGDFVEDALARQIRAAVEAGDVELANGLAAQYEEKFQNGRRSREIKAVLSQLRSGGVQAANAGQLATDAGVEFKEAPSGAEERGQE